MISEAAWTSLLRLYHALEAYNRAFTASTVESRQSPRPARHRCRGCRTRSAVRWTCSRRNSRPLVANPDDDGRAAAAAQRLMGRMSALVDYAWLDRDDPQALLQRLDAHGLRPARLGDGFLLQLPDSRRSRSLTLWRPLHNPRNECAKSLSNSWRRSFPSPRGEADSGVFGRNR